MKELKCTLSKCRNSEPGLGSVMIPIIKKISNTKTYYLKPTAKCTLGIPSLMAGDFQTGPIYTNQINKDR